MVNGLKQTSRGGFLVNCGVRIDGSGRSVKTCAPFAVMMTTSAVMGWWGVVGGVLGTFAALVGYFSLYSSGVASPAKKIYATPMMKHKHAEREMRDLSSAQQQ